MADVLPENEGYDIPWEFVRRRTAGPVFNVTSSSSNGRDGCKEINEAANCVQPHSSIDPTSLNKSTKGSTFQNGGTNNDDIGRRAKPVVAPKPSRLSNGTYALDNGTSSMVNKMPVSDSTNPGMTGTPPCGIRAQQIRKGKYTMNGSGIPTGTVSGSSKQIQNDHDDTANCVVWEYRKPEEDGRPSCEYDAPWDLKVKRPSGANDLQSCPCSNSGNSIDNARQSTDCDVVYDEPWDKRSVVPKAIIAMKLLSTRDSEIMSENTNIRVRSLTSSNENVENGIGKSIGDPAVSCRTDIRSSVNAKPVRIETAFCSKSQPSASIYSKNRYQDKDKLIQQISSDDSMVIAAPVTKENSNNYRRSAEFSCKNAKMVDSQQNRLAERKSTNLVCDQAEADKSQTPLPDYDMPWEFSNAAKAMKCLQLVQRQSQTAPSTTRKEEVKPKLNRHHLSLNFGCAALNSSSTKIDVSLPLNEQMWYHGNITRAEAEQRLSKASEGSFLVRVCETSSRQGDEYALSLKSAKGFMHMKIQQDAQKNWILGYFSQPFESIPIMVRYYSCNKLPIKGAEHMRLLRPVIDQVL